MTRLFFNFIEAFFLFIVCFPGAFKMIIGVDSSTINIIAFLCYTIFASRKPITINRNFNYLILSILSVVSFSIILHPDQIDGESIALLVKGVIYLITALLVFHTYNIGVGKAFISIIFISSIIIIMRGYFLPFDFEKTRSNYLLVSFPIGISAIISLYFLYFGNFSMLIKGLLISSLLFFLGGLLFSGGRGSLLFTVFSMLLIIYEKYKMNKNLFLIYTFPFLLITVYAFYSFVLNFITINSWTLEKLYRLFSAKITEEPRYELYSNALDYFVNHASLLGLGFHAARYVDTSWDPSLPYLESFPLELIFNFGIFGLTISLIIFSAVPRYFRQFGSRCCTSRAHFYIFLYFLLNFSKGWSVYAGFSCITILAMFLACRNAKR